MRSIKHFLFRGWNNFTTRHKKEAARVGMQIVAHEVFLSIWRASALVSNDDCCDA